MPEKLLQAIDRSNVRLARLGAQFAHRHIVEHALAKGANRLVLLRHQSVPCVGGRTSTSCSPKRSVQTYSLLTKLSDAPITARAVYLIDPSRTKAGIAFGLKFERFAAVQ
jgi:hypothetical protein